MADRITKLASAPALLVSASIRPLSITNYQLGVAWRSKPSWSIVATEDRTVHPDLERFAAKRMGAATVEIKSSHVPMLSHPKQVLDVIRTATVAVQKSVAPQSV